MQVTARRPPGVTHIADDLPGLHLLTGGDADGRTVGVQCFQPSTVVDLDVVAVTAAPTVKAVGNGDDAVCGGEDRRTLGAGNVGAGVGADFAGDGVYAMSELRGNSPRNRQRPLQGAYRCAGVVRRHKFFATKSSGEFPKGKRHKRNPSFISLAFLFCFDIIYGITFNLGQKKQETFSDFPLSKTVKFF